MQFFSLRFQSFTNDIKLSDMSETMRIPDKYLHLNAVFQQLKVALSRIGIKQMDVEGILTGDSTAFINLLRLILFSPLRPHLASDLEARHNLTPTLSQYKFTETLFRVCRKNFNVPVRLTIEQFLNGGNYTVKKIEFVTDLCNYVFSYSGTGTAVAKPLPAPKTMLVVEDTAQPAVRPISAGPSPDTMLVEKIHKNVSQLVSSLKNLEEKVVGSLEDLEARMTVMEGRLRIWDKLGPTRE
jgi:hypothetical protein